MAQRKSQKKIKAQKRIAMLGNKGRFAGQIQHEYNVKMKLDGRA